MVDLIDELKRKYTDKYVVVDGSRPELARFRDTYGTVKTVNMNGRALVEFANYHLNIGWYDIDTAFLKVVDTPPEPKVKDKGEPASAGGTATAKPATAKPATAKPATAKPAAPKPAAKPAAGGAKQSTADILAALRAGGGAKAPAAKGEPASAGGEAKAKPAAAPKAPGAAPAKIDRSKMSVADMLAAARATGAKKPAPAGEPASAGGEQAAQTEQVEQAEQVEQVAAPASAPAAEAPAPAAKAPAGPVDKKSMTVDQMLAYCREHDTK